MNQKQTAVNNFSTGLNCAQSVLMAFAEELNLDQKEAFKIASGFGGGLSHNGKVCGAVAGAIMVLGHRHSSLENNSPERKEMLNLKINSFLGKFRLEHGSIDCKDLIEGLSLMTPEGRAEVKARDLRNKTCIPVVESAAKLISNL